MIRTSLAQAIAVAAVSLTALLVAPAASAVTNGTPHASVAAGPSDSISWGGVVTPDSISWGG
ncbi:hypothetical protein BX286_7083 [Streptomyces sp. 3211.6]|uniref:hypothetical protein n=1 Tax=Streptomyces sp. 3211.6 TaxID=1938845 RepID=UPI000C2C8461|nr:hypothetical protein [Streptomyces sp. 3211.6]RKS96920.1 hypothetical protein BX286_7083 [Streptomyces sp. 3211.6]